MLAASVLPPNVAAAGDPHQVPKIDGQIRIDGVLDEPAWQDALVLEIRVEVEPGENIPAPVRTQISVCFSDRHLFAAFRAFDPDPSAIRARYSDRDKLWDDDWVALVLDTFNDERRSFQFFVNPLGIQADSIETAGGGGGPEWDAIWDSAGRIDDRGYVVEIAIPFSSLRFQPKDGEQIWGFDAVRSYPRLVTHEMGLFARDRSNNCYLCQADKIRGFAGASPGRALEFDPTVSAVHSEAREPFPDGRLEEVESTVEPGHLVTNQNIPFTSARSTLSNSPLFHQNDVHIIPDQKVRNRCSDDSAADDNNISTSVRHHLISRIRPS